jgi:hypothetical protein
MTARWAPLAAVLLISGCVSLEEAPMVKQAIDKGQRVILVAYAPPSPHISEDDSKAEVAAKIVPGLGLVVKEAQDQRDLKVSLDLQQYLPRWDPAELFLSSFTVQLTALGQPGKLVRAADVSLPPGTWHKFNKAHDVNDWRTRYFEQRPGERTIGRNYSAFLALDDAVVLEINLVHGLQTDGDGLYAPSLSAVTKLLRANTMHQLWRHENAISEKGDTHTLYELKVKPEDLIYAWKRLMPMLGAQIVDDLRKALQSAGVPLTPTTPFGSGFALTPGALLPAGPGWGPAAPGAAAPATPQPAPAAPPAEALPPVTPFAPRASTP